MTELAKRIEYFPGGEKGFSFAASLSVDQIRNIVAGKNWPNGKTMARMADALGISMDYLRELLEAQQEAKEAS